jgi:hypothetical protein
MFGRGTWRVVEQGSAVAEEEILRLLISKGLIESGDAAACLRGIANHIVARSYAIGAGEAGRPLAVDLIKQADQLDRAVAPTPVIPFYKGACPSDSRDVSHQSEPRLGEEVQLSSTEKRPHRPGAGVRFGW